MTRLKPIDQSTLVGLLRETPGAGAGGPLVFEFVQTLIGLDPAAHGLAARDVIEVEAAWGHIEGDFYWVGGFVVHLQDGRRAYLNGFCDVDTCHHAAHVTVAMLTPGVPYDTVGPRRLPGGKLIQWEAAPERLNDLLHRLSGQT